MPLYIRRTILQFYKLFVAYTTAQTIDGRPPRTSVFSLYAIMSQDYSLTIFECKVAATPNFLCVCFCLYYILGYLLDLASLKIFLQHFLESNVSICYS
jgi:hypothetical protein